MTLLPRNARSFTTVLALTLGILAASAAPALADVTAFIGVTPTPQNHSLKGFAVGMGLLIVGFEFEYANIAEDATEQLAGLKTYSGNVLAQTPIAVAGIQLYGTLGAEGYQERLGTAEVTHFGTNVGGGAKINLVGPLRVRIDYRILHLQGTPINDTYQRFYVGANLKF
jgi:opacity protein-like surface antigen